MSEEIFNNEDENKLRKASKAVSIIAKVLGIISTIGIVFACIGFVTILIVMPNISINTSNNTIKAFNEETTYKFDDGKIYIGDHEVGKYTNSDKYKIDRVLSLNKTFLVVVPAYYLLASAILCIVLNRLFKNMYVVFGKISKAKTPFELENVPVMKLMLVELVVVLIIPGFICGINNLMMGYDNSFGYNFIALILTILVCYAAIYVYKYGCSLEMKKTKKEVKE